MPDPHRKTRVHLRVHMGAARVHVHQQRARLAPPAVPPSLGALVDAQTSWDPKGSPQVALARLWVLVPWVVLVRTGFSPQNRGNLGCPGAGVRWVPPQGQVPPGLVLLLGAGASTRPVCDTDPEPEQPRACALRLHVP